jgi:HSP20 family protein
MDDLIERFFGEPVAWGKGSFAPDVDVDESDTEVRVSADLLGVDEKDIDLSVGDDWLTIKGEKKSEKEEKNGGRRYVERTYGSFERTLALPCEVDADKANASFKKGVLTVTLPKSAKAAKAKKVAISA